MTVNGLQAPKTIFTNFTCTDVKLILNDYVYTVDAGVTQRRFSGCFVLNTAINIYFYSTLCNKVEMSSNRTFLVEGSKSACINSYNSYKIYWVQSNCTFCKLGSALQWNDTISLVYFESDYASTFQFNQSYFSNNHLS